LRLLDGVHDEKAEIHPHGGVAGQNHLLLAKSLFIDSLKVDYRLDCLLNFNIAIYLVQSRHLVSTW
jgi:hypothetical protein